MNTQSPPRSGPGACAWLVVLALGAMLVLGSLIAGWFLGRLTAPKVAKVAPVSDGAELSLPPGLPAG